MLLPVSTDGWRRESIRQHGDEIRTLMTAKLADLDAQVRRP